MAGNEQDMRDESDDPPQTLRVFHQTLGEIEPPAARSSMPRHYAQPVALSDSQWGLLWAESPPDSGVTESKPLTQLWLARRQGSQWLAPSLVVEAKVGMTWGTGQTLIIDRNRQTLVSLVVSESLAERYVMFGHANATLRRIPLSAELVPLNAAFTLTADQRLEFVIHVVPSSGRIASGALIRVRSSDEGMTWTQPDTAALVRGMVHRLRLHEDSAGALHAAWLGDGETLHHVTTSAKGAAWVASDPPVSTGAVFSWVSGIDRCGVYTIVTHVMGSAQARDFESAKWTGSWSDWSHAFPGYAGVYLFDGHTVNGDWYVGWSGGPVDDRGPPLFNAMVTRP